jgi:hypothetical protein
MLQVFLSECYICFTHMLQVFYVYIAYASHVYCNKYVSNVMGAVGWGTTT